MWLCKRPACMFTFQVFLLGTFLHVYTARGNFGIPRLDRKQKQKQIKKQTNKTKDNGFMENVLAQFGITGYPMNHDGT